LYVAPSESLVPAAIVAFGDRPGTLVAILTLAVVGATLGQVGLFVLVRRAGREYVLERGWFGVSEAQLARFDAWFQRWGPVAVPVTNTMLFVRGTITVPAGLSDMRLRTFAVLSAVGTLCSEAVLLAMTLGVLGAV
jgi:membrane protein DedA with SNARE-associated domain